MIAVTQVRGVGPCKSYVDNLIAAGKTRTDALRLLRRRLSDRVFAALLADERRAGQAAQHGAVGTINSYRDSVSTSLAWAA